MTPIYNPAPAVAAGGWTKYDGALEEFMPYNTAPAGTESAGRPWTWTPYVELTPGVGLIFLPHIIHASFRTGILVSGIRIITVEVEIATGAAGVEQTYARFSDTYGCFSTPAGAQAIIATGKSFPCGPAAIPYNTRISFRVRASLDDSVAAIGVNLYLGGYFTTAPASYTHPPFDNYLKGLSSLRLTTIPSGSFQSITAAAWGGWGAGTPSSTPRPILSSSGDPPTTAPPSPTSPDTLNSAPGPPAAKYPAAASPCPAASSPPTTASSSCAGRSSSPTGKGWLYAPRESPPP